MADQTLRKRGEPRSIAIGSRREGIRVEFVRRRKAICIYGWYDSFVGMSDLDIPLEEFCRRLGIQRKDLPD